MWVFIINSMHVRSLIIILIIFFLECFVGSIKAIVITVGDSDDIDHIFSGYEIPQKVIESIDYSCDVLLSRKEFDYLTELFPSSVVTSFHVKKACVYLLAKKKFKQIVLTIDETEQGCSVFFSLHGYWTFSKVTVTGILFDRERYATLYGMDNGEVFEELKHHHAIQKLLEVLRSEGFLQAKIQSFFTYDYKIKAVSVRLHVVRGKQFKCGNIEVAVSYEDSSHNELTLLNSLRSLCTKKLSKSFYQKSKLERIANQIAAYLEQEGYAHSTITMTEKVCYETKTVAILYAISISASRQFIFFGNKFFSKKQLLSQILQLGKSAWLVPASLLAQEIAQIYKDKGFLHSFVEVQEEKNKCIFLIKEGDRLAISHIEIKDSFAYSSDYLVNTFFKQTIKKSYFDYDIFQREKNNLCDFYIKNGYLDIQLVDYSFKDVSCHKSCLVLALDEGKRYTIVDMAIKGFDGTLQLPSLLDGPIYLTNDFIIEQRENIQKQLKIRAQREYIVRPEIKKNDGSSVSLEWNMRPAWVSKKFGKIVALNAVDIPFENIIKECCFTPNVQGESSFVRSTVTRFKTFDVFDAVSLSWQKTKKINGMLDEDYVALQLHYDDPYEVRLKAGFEFKNVSYNRFLGEKLGYKLGGAFIVKNFFHQCSMLRCTADFARFHHELALEYKYPWIFNMPLRGMFKGYVVKYDQPAFLGSKDTLYTAYNNGLLCAMGNSQMFFNWNINFGFDWAKTVISKDVCNEQQQPCFLKIARAINFMPSLLNVFIPYFFIEPTFYIDYLDDKLCPSKGVLTVASIKSMIPISYSKNPSYFVKFLVEQSFFWPFKNVVGALRVRFGHIFHKDFSRVMPSQRFYLGGAESLRGYDRDMAPPLGIYKDEKNNIHEVPRGSKSMVNINMELRFNIFKKWGAVIFHDFGTLGDDLRAHVTKKNMLMTTGLGARYQTPIGPVRFDIGWKWFREQFSKKSFGWYLTVGNAF